jgi:hypothetical protein
MGAMDARAEQATGTRGEPRQRPDGWKRHPRPRSAEGRMNLCGPAIRERREALGLTRPEFIKRLSNATEGRWSPSEADLVNVERQTRTVTDIELVACAAALGIPVSDLISGR